MDVLDHHADHSNHKELIDHLKVKGYDTSGMKCNSSNKLEEFKIREADRLKVRDVLHGLARYNDLRVIDLSRSNVKGTKSVQRIPLRVADQSFPHGTVLEPCFR